MFFNLSPSSRKATKGQGGLNMSGFKESTALCADRYHAVMGNFSLSTRLFKNETLGGIKTTFYVTQRKLPYAPVLGHERMINLLNRSRADYPRSKFLENDRANLSLIAEKLKHSRFPGEVWTVPEGTILFANEPIALVSGPFAMTQMFEVVFEYAFDEPMTLAYQAMKMKEIVGDDIFVSDFSLRRAGSLERAVEASKYLYIGGCDDTSNMEAAFLYGLPTVGTMAHYLTQSFMALTSHLTKETNAWGIRDNFYDESGNLKHGERLCFEYWLDAHPKGTVCLIDTISLKLGLIHVIEAALNSESRKKALKAVRLDSGDLAKGIIYARKMLDENGLNDVKIIITGDLDAEKLSLIAKQLLLYREEKELINAERASLKIFCRSYNEEKLRKTLQETLKFFGVIGVAGGTKFIAEIPTVAGVIFKMIDFCNKPTLKLSGTAGKETLPGKLQLWRFGNKEGKYILDVIALQEENLEDIWRGVEESTLNKTYSCAPLLQPFYKQGMSPELKTPQELKEFVNQEKERFEIPLHEYVKKRVQLSSALSRLKEKLRSDYTKTPNTKIKVINEEDIFGID